MTKRAVRNTDPRRVSPCPFEIFPYITTYNVVLAPRKTITGNMAERMLHYQHYNRDVKMKLLL